MNRRELIRASLGLVCAPAIIRAFPVYARSYLPEPPSGNHLYPSLKAQIIDALGDSHMVPYNEDENGIYTVHIPGSVTALGDLWVVPPSRPGDVYTSPAVHVKVFS